jgi:hypothetical protein
MFIYSAAFTEDESTNANCCLLLKSHLLQSDEMIKYRKVFFSIWYFIFDSLIGHKNH